MPRKKSGPKEAEVTTAAHSNPDMKKYSKLLGTADYDHEAAEQLADALNEINDLDRRASQLRQVVKENEELHQFIWCTADGVNRAIHDLDDEHLSNIMMHLLRQNRPISRAIRGEAMRRDLVIPAKVSIDWAKGESKAVRGYIQESLHAPRVPRNIFEPDDEEVNW